MNGDKFVDVMLQTFFERMMPEKQNRSPLSSAEFLKLMKCDEAFVC